jgi:hypothetical protein
MIRVRRAVEIRLMTGDALFGRCLEYLILVTTKARRGNMRAGKRERRTRVVKARSPFKRGHLVTLNAIGRESRRLMIGRSCTHKIVSVATEAIGRRAGVLFQRRIRVTTLAVERRVFPKQRKPRRLMLLNHIRDFPRRGRVAACAIRP